MNPQQASIAHSLYELYETLPGEVQKSFLEELLQKKHSAIAALAFPDSFNGMRHKVIFGVMEDNFSIPDNFDAPLPENIISEFYTGKL